MKYESKKMMSIIFLETLNIEWGQIDPKGNRRVNSAQFEMIMINDFLFFFLHTFFSSKAGIYITHNAAQPQLGWSFRCYLLWQMIPSMARLKQRLRAGQRGRLTSFFILSYFYLLFKLVVFSTNQRCLEWQHWSNIRLRAASSGARAIVTYFFINAYVILIIIF